MNSVEISDDDFFLGEDIDLTDETALRSLEATVAEVVGDSRGVRVTVLSAEQWDTAVSRLVAGALRSTALQRFHILPKPKAPGHLLVGPTTLQGLNEDQAPIVAEVVYALLKAGKPLLPPMFCHGAADLLAEEVSQRVGISFYTHNYPREAQFCAELIKMLQCAHGAHFDQLQWLNLLMTSPTEFFQLVRRKPFGQLWMTRSREHGLIPQGESRPRLIDLTKILTEEDQDITSQFVICMVNCMREFCEGQNKDA